MRHVVPGHKERGGELARRFRAWNFGSRSESSPQDSESSNKGLDVWGLKTASPTREKQCISSLGAARAPREPSKREGFTSSSCPLPCHMASGFPLGVCKVERTDPGVPGTGDVAACLYPGSWLLNHATP